MTKQGRETRVTTTGSYLSSPPGKYGKTSAAIVFLNRSIHSCSLAYFSREQHRGFVQKIFHKISLSNEKVC